MKRVGNKMMLGLIIVSVSLSGVFVSVLPAPAASDPFIGEIMYVPYTFCPRGWAEASGQLLQISQNTALFSLLGTTYGGDGRVTFALPDLRGRVPVHYGTGPGLSSYTMGQRGGQEQVLLNENQMPIHTHDADLWGTNGRGNSDRPENRVLARKPRTNIYSSADADKAMGPSSITVDDAGGSQAHENRPPYLTLRACIAVVGIYPSRN